MGIKCLLLLSLLYSPLLSAQVADIQVPHLVGDYFVLNSGGPELVSVEMFEHPELGRTLKISIRGRRSQDEQDLIFAFRAAAAVVNLTKRSYDLLWVEMELNYKEVERINAIAPVNCSIDAIILDTGDPRTWWTDCLQLL